MRPGNAFDYAGDAPGRGTERNQADRSHARALAERLYAERRRRDLAFPHGLFGEPAWDLLLAMFAAREKEQSTILSQAYRMARVSDTTGRRLLEQLEREGLISRRREPRSRKTWLVELTDDAVDKLGDFLGS